MGDTGIRIHVLGFASWANKVLGLRILLRGCLVELQWPYACQPQSGTLSPESPMPIPLNGGTYLKL